MNRPPPIETELKFRLGAAALAQLRDHPELQGSEQVNHLRSVYFDTPERDLHRGGLGLRVRDTGEGFVQTVKQRDGGAGGSARHEWEATVPSAEVDPAALAGTPAGELLHGKLAMLEPVFTTTVERRARSRRKDGSLIEVSFDRGEITAGEHREPIQELELELKDGDAAALFAIGRRIAQDSSVGLSFESKSDRGYRVADETAMEPREAEDPALPTDIAAAKAFQRIALACLAQACSNAELLRAVRRPEAIHQMRVGLRRLRAAFAAFKPMLVDDSRAAINGELKWLAGELDTARDLDVFIRGVFRPSAATTDDPNLAALGRQLLQAQTAAYERAVAAVSSQRYALLLIDTAAWIEAGPWLRSQDSMPAGLRSERIETFAAKALDRLHKTVRKRGRDLDRLDPISRHQLRIRAKRLRYATEFFGALFNEGGESKTKYLASLKRLQDRLGALNDIAVARDRILAKASLKQAGVAFAAGRIVGRREGDEEKLLEKAVDEFERFRAAVPFWRGRS